MRAILGVSAYYHDSAAALVVDGHIVAAAQEERFTRRKHDASFPVEAIRYCLSEAGLRPEQLDYVGFYDKPLLKFDRMIETYLGYAPAGFASFAHAMPRWLQQKLYLPREMRTALDGTYRKRFVFTQHHESHAASAFYPSPFEEAAILTLDGVGEWATGSVGIGRGNRIELIRELRFPHSLGMLYSAFTYYCGFSVNSGEYKLMGLAPYGEARYADLIREKLIDLREDGSFRMDMSYFAYGHGLTMTSEKFHRLFGGAPRKPDTLIEPRFMDLAASIQAVTEDIMLRMARGVHATTGMRALCLAGGVALNCVANGRILREGPFEDIWIQPAAGDAGGALGVALFIWHQLLGNARSPQPKDGQQGSLLGPAFSDAEIHDFLRTTGAPYECIPDDEELCERVARALADGKVVGWFQGRMEFGPRALGSRSILGDPRRPEMQTTINLKVKFREGFRPFAPAVLQERAHEYFEMPKEQHSPYMLLVMPVREGRRRPLTAAETSAQGIGKLKLHRSELPAITHVDDSARVQTVDAERHGLCRKLLEAFDRLTGCPVLVNTSFNLGWDPIVCKPKEAFDTFMGCEIDLLCLGHYVLEKRAQPAAVRTAGADDRVLEDLLRCPRDGAPLRIAAGRATCQAGHVFEFEDGILKAFWPHDGIADVADVTETVKAFYEATPFPNYDDHDSVRSLIEKSRAGRYARALDTTIPYNATVLDAGCGTGQLANFLGISCRRLVGADVCLNSLKLGERFRREHELRRVRFVQMNLFQPPFAREEFDVVLCNGVLHHTSDPFGGFASLVSLVKPGGHIVVGLYNRYGRLATDARGILFRLTGGRGRWIDPMLRTMGKGREAKERAWFADQYRHPHESEHTIGEVLQWFQRTGLAFVRGVPAVTPDVDDLETDLFAPRARGNRLEHLLVQLRMMFVNQAEGGLFVMIGRKPERRATGMRGAAG